MDNQEKALNLQGFSALSQSPLFETSIVPKVDMTVGIFLGVAIVTYAIMNLFVSKSVTTSFTKKQIFQFDFNTGLNGGAIGPGDSFSVDPFIYNDATEDMYVFIEIEMPLVWTTRTTPLYSFTHSEDWCVVESDGGVVVYAYTAGSELMTVLTPGESTVALTEQMTMRSITNAEYAGIDDINITLTGYAIGVEDVSDNPTEAWFVCKEIGENQ